jgi:hypothetical protein
MWRRSDRCRFFTLKAEKDKEDKEKKGEKADFSVVLVYSSGD